MTSKKSDGGGLIARGEKEREIRVDYTVIASFAEIPAPVNEPRRFFLTDAALKHVKTQFTPAVAPGVEGSGGRILNARFHHRQ